MSNPNQQQQNYQQDPYAYGQVPNQNAPQQYNQMQPQQNYGQQNQYGQQQPAYDQNYGGQQYAGMGQQQMPQAQYQQPAYQQQQQPNAMPPVKEMDIESLEKADHVNFVKKVYTILAAQLSITTLCIVVIQVSDNLRYKAMHSPGIFIACSILACVTSIVLICCFGRSYPANFILLFAFTIFESVAIAGLTAAYTKNSVIMAGAATAATTIALTIYAYKTKTKIEVFGAMAFVVCLAMLPIAIVSFFVGNGALYTLYLALGILLYSLFLIIDTMMIVKGTTMSGQGCGMDDYIIGAMMLYLDIIMLFIYILRLFGDRN